MSKFIKENWFVSLLVVVFAIVTAYYIIDSNKGKLKGKTVDGQDIVYSIADENVSANTFYDELYKKNGASAVSYLFTKDVAEQAVETTKEMKDFAKTQAASIIRNFAAQYPNDYKEQLDHEMKLMGYSGMDDLEQYLIVHQKIQALTAEYAKANFDDLKIRNISYILVKADEPGKQEEATENEQKRMDAVDAAFAKGDDFAKVAKDFSEDPSSAPAGGVLGTIDKNTANLDKAFLEASLGLKEGETSQWVHSDQFGWFKIHVNAATPETLETVAKEQAKAAQPADAKEEDTKVDPYLSLISSYDTTLVNKALFAKAEELGMDFHGNTELENKIRAALGVEPIEVKEDSKKEEEKPAETSAPVESAKAE